MKLVSCTLLCLLISQISSAATLYVGVKNENSWLGKGTINFASVWKDGSLALASTQESSREGRFYVECSVSQDKLKEAGIDAIALVNLVRNSQDTTDITIFCKNETADILHFDEHTVRATKGRIEVVFENQIGQDLGASVKKPQQ